MLPSGNDAAVTLAENFSEQLNLRSNKSQIRVKKSAANPERLREPVIQDV
jgi:hypothetical protein